MANKIKQFRYYADDSSNNQPEEMSPDVPVTYANYVSGDVFGKHFPVIQLGIQSLPGTKFYLNNALEPIIIGVTGIYELELNEQTQITKIQFNSDSMKLLKDNQNAYLIVDIVYDDGEE